MTGVIDEALIPIHERIAQNEDKSLSKDDYDKLVCYKTSADSALDILVEGSAGISNVLSKAVTNPDNLATQEEMLKTLSMLSAVSQIIQNLLTVRTDAEYLLNESKTPSISCAEVVTMSGFKPSNAS
jgi:hypothetical protein